MRKNMLHKIYHYCREFAKHTGGTIAIEFALVLPIMLVLLFPTIDYARYILLQQKVIKAAYVMADSVAMSRPVETDTTQEDIDKDGTYLTEDLLRELTDTVDILMAPFPADGDGGDRYQAEITQIFSDPASGVVGTGWSYDQNSQALVIGGGAATLPPSLQGNMDPGENLIRVRFTARYEPITPPLQGLGVPFLAQTTLEHTAYFRARYGDLRTVWR
jgi:hypothetical protein